MEAGSAFLLTSCLVMCFVAVFELVRAAVGFDLKAAWRRVLDAVRNTLGAKARSWVLLSKRVGRNRERKRVEQMRRALPGALRLLAIALDSGSSLTRAFAYAAENCEEPLAAELKRAVWDLEAGHGFDEAMLRLRKRVDFPEFAYLAAAMEIQHRCGGSLSQILKSVSSALRQRAQVETQLAVKTSQGRLSAKVVTIMPLVILAALSLLSPGYLEGFFSSALGVVMLVAALALEGVGVILVRRAANPHAVLGRQGG